MPLGQIPSALETIKIGEVLQIFTGLVAAVAKLSANRLVGTGFTS